MGLIFTFVLTNTAFAQRKTVDTSTSLTISADTLIKDSLVIADSLALDSLGGDTLTIDSVSNQSLEDRLGIRISSDALPSEVTANASDSAVLDMTDNNFELYGNAKVNYENMQLDAYKVTYKQSSNIVTAALSEDTAIQSKGKPTFSQGQEKFTYDSLQYNFKSKRAIVRNARSQYGEGYVYSEQVKRNPDQTIYGLNNVYTTCALGTPHYGIRAKKIKVIPGRVAATGPANIVIENVPTPLFLPFGLFPITQGQRSGFKLPTYTIEQNRGLGLLGGGYYFSLSQKTDLLVETNLYSKGSWATNFLSNYNNRYRYNGSLAFKYAYNKTGEEFETNAAITKDFNVQWTHRSDPKSRPGTNFSASVDFGTSTYNANNTFTASQILQNQYQSNITYSKTWANKPYSLSVAARHSQNTNTRRVDVTLPEINFFVNTFNPFQGKNSVGTHWYDKITTQYTLKAINQTSFYDSNFSFSNIPDFEYNNGIVHDIPISASYNIFRFINMTPRVAYKEYWLTRQRYQYYNANYDRIDTIDYNGFYTSRDFSASIDFNTRIYGVKMFKKGKIAGIRHVLTPSVGFGYIPNYAAAPFYYGYQTRLRPNEAPAYRSTYEGSIPGVPGMGQFGDFRSAIPFSLDNNLQVKVRSEKDSTGFKNVRLIDNFTLSSAYDIAADSFNWSNINVRFGTLLFNIINISAGAVFDPYVFDYESGRRLKQTMLESNRGIARLQTANVSLGGSINGKPKDKKTPPPGQEDEFSRMMQYGRYNDYVDFSVPYNLTFSYSLNLTNQYSKTQKKDSLYVSQHSINLSGDVNITPRWKFGFTTYYDLISKQLQTSSFDIYRDMHCWEMRLSTIPFGQRKSFYFTLQVKAQVLNDLKLIRRRDYRDAL